MLTILRKSSFQLFVVFSLVIIGLVFKLFIGFDPDEQYAFAMMYRFVNGDSYLIDLSEAHQFSALFMTPVYWISCALAAFISLHPVVLFRLFSILINLLLNYRVFLFIKKRYRDEKLALLSWAMMITALPKSIISLEHSNLAMIFLSWVAIDVIRCFESDENGVMLGVDCSLLSLVYPPLVFIYVPLILMLIVRGMFRQGIRIVGVSVFVLLLVILPILSKVGYRGLIESVGMVLMDGSHALSLSERLIAFLVDIVFLLKYVALYAVLYFAFIILKRRFQINTLSNEFILISIPFLVATIQFISRPTSPMAGNGRYLLLMLYSLLPLMRQNNGNGSFATVIVTYLISFILIYVTSNTNLLSASGFLMFSPILYVMINKDLHTNTNFLKAFLTLVVISQCVTMIATYRTYGTTPHSIFHLDLKRDEKVVKGVWYQPRCIDLFEEISENKDSVTGDAVIISSIYPYSYNILQKKVGAPLTIATLVFNEQWELYAQKHPYHNLDVIAGRDNDNTINTEVLLQILSRYYSLSKTEVFNTYDLYHFVRSS